MRFRYVGRGFLSLFLSIFLATGCKTKADLKREQDLEAMKTEFSRIKTSQVDDEVSKEEVKADVSRLEAFLTQRSQYQDEQLEHIKNDLTTVTARIQALEQKLVSEELDAVKAPPKLSGRESLDAGKKAFEEGNFEQAIRLLKDLAKSGEKGEVNKKAHFLLAESYFGAKNFASAALEFGEFKKVYSKDTLVPTAIYRQANAFRSLGKKTEAKLFYQELTDRFPKHTLSAKARQELKVLK